MAGYCEAADANEETLTEVAGMAGESRDDKRLTTILDAREEPKG